MERIINVNKAGRITNNYLNEKAIYFLKQNMEPKVIKEKIGISIMTISRLKRKLNR